MSVVAWLTSPALSKRTMRPELVSRNAVRKFVGSRTMSMIVLFRVKTLLRTPPAVVRNDMVLPRAT